MNAIKPSRELDKIIAVEVMGLEVVGEDTVAYYGGEGMIVPGTDPASHSEYAAVEPLYLKKCHCEWMTESDKADGRICEEDRICGHYTACLSVVPRYSEDIAAAWQVVTKLMEGNFMVSVNQSHESGYWVHVYPPQGAMIDADSFVSAPHAICLAARKAVAKDAGEG